MTVATVTDYPQVHFEHHFAPCWIFVARYLPVNGKKKTKQIDHRNNTYVYCVSPSFLFTLTFICRFLCFRGKACPPECSGVLDPWVSDTVAGSSPASKRSPGLDGFTWVLLYFTTYFYFLTFVLSAFCNDLLPFEHSREKWTSVCTCTSCSMGTGKINMPWNLFIQRNQ